MLYGGVEVAAQTAKSDSINTAKEYANTDDMFESKSFGDREIAMAQFFLDATTQKEIRDAFKYYDELIRGKKTLFGETKPKIKKQAADIVFVEKARANPEREKQEIIHNVIVRAQRLETLGNDNSNEIAKLDKLLGKNGWKWNAEGTQIKTREQAQDDLTKALEALVRDNPELTPKIKRAILDAFYDWIDGNPLMDYTPGAVTFQNWIQYHYPGYEDVQADIWITARPALRANPNARFIHIGICKKISIDQGKTQPVILKGPHAMLTNKAMNKLFIVPFTEMKEIDDEVADMKAEKVFAQWHNYAADDNNYTVNWPDEKQAKNVGTADQIWYASDKVLREYDGKGKVNIYHHQFDRGKRPCLKKGNNLIVTNLKINERGILN